MDPRPSQPPYARPPERPLIHNPNHQSPPHSQPPPTYAGYPPPTSQPQAPLHVPFTADPYASSRRDPFIPSPAHQHNRRSSYGVHGGGEGIVAAGQGERPVVNGAWGAPAQAAPSIHHHQNHSGPPPPPPPSMSNSHNPPGPPSYGYDGSKRRSLEGASPPNMYRAPTHDAPPPPSFPRSHMPPPSSPQQQQQPQNNHPSQQQGQRPPFPSFTGARELPGLAAGHRPGSSMSISSLIGGDAASSDRPSQSQSSPPNPPINAPPAAPHTMHPPSPRRGHANGPRQEFQPYRRQPSPERSAYPNNASRMPERHGYTAGSPPRSYTGSYVSPEQHRQPQPPSSQPYKPMIFQNSPQYTPSPHEPHSRDQRGPGATVPPRPNSQPSGPPAPSRPEPQPRYEPSEGRRTAYEHVTEARRRTLGESHHARPNATELMSGQPSKSDRDRPVTVQPVSHSVFSPPGDHRDMPPGAPQASQGPHQAPSGLWRQAPLDDARRQPNEPRREEPPAPYRPTYGTYPPASQVHGPYGHPASEEMVRGRSLDHPGHRVVEQYHVPPTSDPNATEKHRAEQLSRSMSSGGASYPGGRSVYDAPPMQHSKSFLGLSAEASRRTGRASPLPQAVQGAQTQPLGVAKEPGIKTEFGRMFSGLGSGLGTSTPSRQSPLPQGVGEIMPPGNEIHELRLQRVNSQTGRKPKRVKDEEGMFDGESIDGRGTPNMGARGAKRSRGNPPVHHHHHHTHAHHHHHHHHKPDDELLPGALNAPPPPSVAFNQNRYNPSVPQNGGTPQPPHHHHHYHPTPHHHHHVPRTNQQPRVPSPKPPQLELELQPVLDEAAKRPRRHLGSQLYEATAVQPKPSSPLDDQFSFASKPKPLPRFETNPINCTYTIRIPRYYLTPRQRQQIVLQRHLWGAGIYRDDSDPIAAAIHSGWIRGEWDETVDVNMLDHRIMAPHDASDGGETLTRRPAAPVTPPADMELHITVLILPTLQEYISTCEYGIRSRKSVGHDGLSFMIHYIKWEAEGFGSRGQERGAAALKKRLDEQSIDAGHTLLSLMNGGRDALRTVNGTAKLHA